MLEVDCGMSGSVAGMLLCDNGARVVKVEPSQGAPERQHPGHRVWNRGKESWVLDLQHPAQVAQLNQVLRRADVLIHRLSPSDARALHLNNEDLLTLNPRLVICAISSYGVQGRLSAYTDNDSLVHARFGLPHLQRGWFTGPSYISHPLASIGAAMLIVQGICGALLAKTHTQRGQIVEASLLGGLYTLTAYCVGDQVKLICSGGEKAFGPSPFYSMYECADGHWLQLGCIHRGFVKKAIEAMGLTRVLDDPRFGDGFGLPPGEVEDAMFDHVERAIKTKSFAEWAQILEAADVPTALVQETAALLKDPQYRLNGVTQVNDPVVGLMEQMGLPIRLSETPGQVKGAAPSLDAHALLPSEPEQAIVNHQPRAATSTQAPLIGIRVLEIANVIAGPLAGRLLADLGAEVIKLEALDGGDIARRNGSSAFLPLNSGKRGIAVDLRSTAGQALGQRLARWADVVIDNMRPGVAEKLGMGWELLRQLNPRLVYCHVTAFGSRGPYAHKPGLDPLAGALTGVQQTQGAYCGKPVYLEVAAVDHTTALLACNGVLLALLARERTGKGQRVETNLLDGAALINAHELTAYTGKPPRAGLPRTQWGLHALHGLYETADGWLCLTLERGNQWPALCEALARNDLYADIRFADATARLQHDEALTAAFTAAFRQHNTSEWLAKLESAGVPCAPVVADFNQHFVCDAQTVANEMIVTQQHATLGEVQMAHQWLRFSKTPIACTRPTPLLGQHTDDILTELGYSAAEIEALLAQRVIARESGT